MNIKYFEI